MDAVKVIGEVDQDHRLVAIVPESIAPGRVEVVVLAKLLDEGDDRWMAGIAREWHEDLTDSRQDIYSLEDGVPVDGHR